MVARRVLALVLAASLTNTLEARHAESDVSVALLGDSECEGDAAQCALNALQLQGTKAADVEEESAGQDEAALSMQDCFESNTYYQERHRVYTMEGTHRMKVRSPEDCMQKCQNMQGCGHFSYWRDGGCLLTSTSAHAKYHHGVIAGPPSCGVGAGHGPGTLEDQSKGSEYADLHHVKANYSSAEAELEAQGMEYSQHTDHTHAYSPTVEALKVPSNAPLHSFYVYRATSGRSFPMENVNTANAAGVMWYLHNEVVRWVPRRFGIDRIIRFKVHYRAPQPLFDKGMNFGVRYAFDSGKCTGPGDCDKELGKYGNFVGCNLVYDFPTYQFKDGKYYPSPTWYSFPGDCSDQDYHHQTQECKASKPGGACSGTPTGTGDCTYSFEPAGFVMLDDVVGLKDYQSFIHSGGREYVAGFGVSQGICRHHHETCDKGIHLDFWDWKHSEKYNKKRVEKLLQTFKEKYPGQEDLPEVPCDFNNYHYYH
eukprot:TRINITY_DN77253_c0_g1_i1.p1 TRINITY_DN77253_c0_g1~~TRINITY_DN77253_c0_g1_i1.p1  ORF type:complete len:481 (+),score=67.59 TRINITY_DN77253_c0_g1_i1:77-1519(+)